MPELHEPLSKRERQVLRLVSTGATNLQIAQELSISVNTVKVHLRNIFTKLGVTSRTEASMHAIREGWITLEPPADTPEEPESPVQANGDLPLRKPLPSRWQFWASLSTVAVLLLTLVFSLTGGRDRWFPRSNPSPSAIDFNPDERWSTRATIPSPRSDLALVAFEGSLYAIGGEGVEGVSNANEVFDPLTDSWTTLAPKPTAVAQAQGAVLRGHIYVPGGLDDQGRPTAVTEVYLIERNQWISAASLPRPLSAYALVSFEGHLYLFGGWDGSRYRDEILRYTSSTDQWETVDRLPFPWGHAGAVEANDRIFLVGGLNDDGPLDVILDYSPFFGARTTIPLPGISLGRTRVTTLGNYLIVLAEPEGASMPQLWTYNILAELWQPTESSPIGLCSGMAIGAIGTESVFLIGGKEGETTRAQTQAYRVIYFATLPGSVP